MRTQSVLSIALVAFSSSSLAALVSNSVVERDPYPADVRAAIVAVGQDFTDLATRDLEEVAAVQALSDANYVEKRAEEADSNEVAAIQALSDANHAEKRAVEDDSTTLRDYAANLAAADANHNQARDEAETTTLRDYAATLAAADANHHDQ